MRFQIRFEAVEFTRHFKSNFWVPLERAAYEMKRQILNFVIVWRIILH